MAKVRVGAAAELPPGHMAEALAAGARYVICNVAGDLHAMSGLCPHRGGPLAHGALHGYTVVCPWHAWEFDCRTGVNGYDRTCRIETYPVCVDDGQIYIEVP